MRFPGFLTRAVKRRLHSMLIETARETARDIDLTALRVAAEDSASFVVSHAPKARGYANKFDLLDAALRSAKPNGLCCEFGVFEGRTINHIASRWKGKVHGFDSFDGLPEDWRADFNAGRFKLEQLPQVSANVDLHKGLFHDSIPGFAQ